MSEAFELARPWVLAGLALLPLFAVLRRRLLDRDAVPHAPLQYRRSGRRSGRWLAARLRLPAELALVALLLLGLAGPYRTTRLELMEDEGIDVLLVLDVSLSMLAEDFPPNRLEALRRVARDFVRKSGSHRLGIVVFAGDVFVQTPLTTDHRVLFELLDSVTVYTVNQSTTASGGTAIGDALLVAAERLAAAKVEERDQALVLITDGESNLGIDPVLAARYVARQEVRLYAIGIGSREPVPVLFEGRPVGGDDPYLASLDDAQLEAVAAAAGGRYERAADAGSLESLFVELSRLEGAPFETRTVELRSSYASFLALLALPFYGLYLLLGGIVLRRPLR